MRSLQLLALALLATAAKAETFNITFNPTTTLNELGEPFRHLDMPGVMVTDGVCRICSISSITLPGDREQHLDRDGILSIAIGGAIGSVETFALGDAFYDATPFSYSASVTFDAKTGRLFGALFNFGSEFVELGGTPNFCPALAAPCPTGPGSYHVDLGGSAFEWGTFSVTAVPEPSAGLLLATGLGLVLFTRRNTLRCFLNPKDNQQYGGNCYQRNRDDRQNSQEHS